MDLNLKCTSVWAFLIALLLSGFVGRGATAQKTVSVRGNVGASFFRAPEVWSRTLHSGVSIGLEVGIPVYRGLSITAHGGYDQFPLNRENLRLTSQGIGGVPVSQGDVSFLSGALGLRYTYYNETDAHPYISTGVGFYRAKQSDRKAFEQGAFVGQRPPESATELGVHLAIGSLFRLDDTYAVFFEPRYIFYDVQTNPSGSLRYFTLRLGVDVQL